MTFTKEDWVVGIKFTHKTHPISECEVIKVDEKEICYNYNHKGKKGTAIWKIKHATRLVNEKKWTILTPIKKELSYEIY